MITLEKESTMARKIKTVEREKYSERELEDLAKDVYDQTVNVMGIEMDALRILKELDEPAYNEALEALQEYEDKYLCPTCKSEYDDEDEALDCDQDPHGHAHVSENARDERIEELEEKKQEFILNESWIPEEQSPSWGDVAEANAKAESMWDETEEGRELKSLLEGNDE